MNYKELCSPENLFRAFDEFIRGKRKKKDVIQFQENLEENIFELSSQLQGEAYEHGPYFRFHIWDPRFRIIHKALVRDRIVHHALFEYLYGVFNKAFIFHSYSSRLKKGTHLGVKNLHKMMRKVSKNFTQESYALKCDIKSFFASIDHDILLEIIQKNIGDEEIFNLIRLIVKSFHTHTHRYSTWQPHVTDICKYIPQ